MWARINPGSLSHQLWGLIIVSEAESVKLKWLKYVSFLFLWEAARSSEAQ